MLFGAPLRQMCLADDSPNLDRLTDSEVYSRLVIRKTPCFPLRRLQNVPIPAGSFGNLWAQSDRSVKLRHGSGHNPTEVPAIHGQSYQRRRNFLCFWSQPDVHLKPGRVTEFLNSASSFEASQRTDGALKSSQSALEYKHSGVYSERTKAGASRPVPTSEGKHIR